MSAAAHADPSSRVLAELLHADTIINTMLNALTIHQKAKVHEQLDAAGVSREGMTRANERRAAIDAAKAGAGLSPAEPAKVAGGAASCAIEAVDIASLGLEGIGQLRSILNAIRALAQAQPVIGELASLGVMLAGDCYNTIDCKREEHQDAFDALAAAGSAT